LWAQPGHNCWRGKDLPDLLLKLDPIEGSEDEKDIADHRNC
jgi:hypothetical protein